MKSQSPRQGVSLQMGGFNPLDEVPHLVGEGSEKLWFLPWWHMKGWWPNPHDFWSNEKRWESNLFHDDQFNKPPQKYCQVEESEDRGKALDKCKKNRDNHWVPLLAMQRELVDNILSIICVFHAKDVVEESGQPPSKLLQSFKQPF